MTKNKKSIKSLILDKVSVVSNVFKYVKRILSWKINISEKSNRVKEGYTLLLTAISIFIMLSLLTYADIWDVIQSKDKILPDNAMGEKGYLVASHLLGVVGIMAYTIPMAMFVAIYRIWSPKKTVSVVSRWIKIEPSIAFALFVVFGSALVHIELSKYVQPDYGFGGHIGAWLGDSLMDNFSLLGSYLILFVVLEIAMASMTNLSWISVITYIKGNIKNLSGKIKKHYINVKEKKKQKEELKAKAEKVVDKKPVQIIAPTPKKDVEKVSIKEAAKKLVDKASSSTARKENEGKSKPKEKPKSLFVDANKDVSLPSLGLLDEPAPVPEGAFDENELKVMSELLEVKLAEFGVKAEVIAAQPGPVVTRFEIQPASGVKASKISGLAKDLARSMSVMAVRVVEVIPGKPYVGIEVPNNTRLMVNFQDVLASNAFDTAKSPLTMALGHDISGKPVVADLAKMPHLLVAGTTGSGKSVGVNSMLLSLLYKATPDELRLLLVDPKMLELSVYEGIPHLIAPVVTDMKDASNGLRWCVAEMERRYKLMASVGVRNLAGFNDKVQKAIDAGAPMKDPLWVKEDSVDLSDDQEAPDLEKLPSIVVVVDEFADMIMVVGKKVEELIARIAQKARAAGIHLILATQRPSVDVITGLIKANVPTRIAFQVSSKIDSRTILDQGGAEQLLGNGDMLYLPPGTAMPHRVHGAFVSDDEVHRVAEDWKSKGQPNYIEGVLEEPQSSVQSLAGLDDDASEADLLAAAIDFVIESKKCSISAIQRKLKVGYNRSAKFVEQMEEMGIVSAPNGNGVRELIRK